MNKAAGFLHINYAARIALPDDVIWTHSENIRPVKVQSSLQPVRFPCH